MDSESDVINTFVEQIGALADEEDFTFNWDEVRKVLLLDGGEADLEDKTLRLWELFVRED